MKISEYQRKRTNISFIGIIVIIILLLIGGVSLWFQVKNGNFGKVELQVESGFGEAEIKVDEQKIGVTPYTKSLMAGQHVVEISKNHNFYDPWIQEFNFYTYSDFYIEREIGPSRGFSSGLVEYYEPAGTGIAITSFPDGAEVTVDGKILGKTPIFLPEISAGTKAVTVEKDGFIGKSFSI